MIKIAASESTASDDDEDDNNNDDDEHLIVPWYMVGCGGNTINQIIVNKICRLTKPIDTVNRPKNKTNSINFNYNNI